MLIIPLQGDLEMDGLEQKAKASGASQLVVKDLKEEFVQDYIFPCLRAGAVYERKYLLGTSMARPVIAKVMLLLRHKCCQLRIFKECIGLNQLFQRIGQLKTIGSCLLILGHQSNSYSLHQFLASLVLAGSWLIWIFSTIDMSPVSFISVVLHLFLTSS